MQVRIWNYGNYSSSNYGACRAVQIGSLTLYFSYETIIAFKDSNTPLVISENCYSRTTGKHLNWINPNKQHRQPREMFEQALKIVLENHNLEV